jgi:phospholipid transport system substrate-binding protein
MKTNVLHRAVVVGTLLLALMPLHAAEKIDNSSPQKLIETSSKLLLTDLDANRAAYRKDISGLYKVIDTQFLPHVDVSWAAQQVLGKHWRAATPEQKKRFTEAVYRSLLTTYGKALIDFTSDQMKVKPSRADPAAMSATVETVVRTRTGSNVNVNYVLRRETAAGEWKVWDVMIEGVRYVKALRDDYGAEIDQKGLDAVLARLEKDQAAK